MVLLPGRSLPIQGGFAEAFLYALTLSENIFFVNTLFPLCPPGCRQGQGLYKKKYYREVDFIAFYAPGEKAIYIAADEAKSVVLAHKIAHAVIRPVFRSRSPCEDSRTPCIVRGREF